MNIRPLPDTPHLRYDLARRDWLQFTACPGRQGRVAPELELCARAIAKFDSRLQRTGVSSWGTARPVGRPRNIEFYTTLSFKQKRDFMPDVPYLLPASSWARGANKKTGDLPPVRLPSQVTHVAADSGGFVATKIWGDYRYTPGQYVDWLRTFPDGVLKWAATMDYCCEKEITGENDGVIADRQFKTTLNAWLFWNQWRSATWAWIPTVQGWAVEDYQRHARELKPLIYEMQAHYKEMGNPYFRVGIGTLCARADTTMIQDVVFAVQRELPGIPLHLWGVKLGYLKSRDSVPDRVVSFDTAAWGQVGLKRTGIEARQRRIEMGISKSHYAFDVALPEYQAKVDAALNAPKQRTIWQVDRQPAPSGGERVSGGAESGICVVRENGG